MIDVDIERVFNEADYPGLKIAGTFVELDEYLRKLLEVVPYARDQALVRFQAELRTKAKSLSLDDLKESLAQIKWVTEDLMPKFFFGAFVLALWAAYELAVTRLANYVRKKENSALVISDLREPNTRRRLGRYIEAVMHEPLTVPPELCNRIDELLLVRNCMAHANGDLDVQREDRRKKAEDLAKANVGITILDNTIVVNELFAREYLKHVISFVNTMLTQVHAKYPRA